MSKQTNIPEEFQSFNKPKKDWSEIVAMVGDLPPLPAIATQALSIVEDPETTAIELTEVLKNDPALAARVLKIANSALFSRQREISTLNQAVVMIGFKALKGVIVAATLRQIRKTDGRIEREIWQNSTCTAITANTIARALKKPYLDEIFLLGLLHDLGKLVLIQQIPEDYRRVYENLQQGQSFLDQEAEALGYTHPLIGALVTKKWNFSPETCQVILHSDDPSPLTIEDQTSEKIAIIKLANLLSRKIGQGSLLEYPEYEEEINQLAGLLTIDTETINKIEESVLSSYNEQSSIYD